MPEARRELLDAATSYQRSGENRLTEIFASVLASHEGLAVALFSSVGLPCGDRFRVFTQRKVAPACIPDMVVESLSQGGARVSVLWSEHKTVSGFRHEQREDYAIALKAEPGVGALLTLTIDQSHDGAGPWHRQTWQEVGELADSVGAKEAGPDWRAVAVRPDAMARLRLLHELLWYLEQEGFAVTRAVTSDDVDVFQRFLDSVEVVAALTELAARRIGGFIEKSDGYDPDTWGTYWFHIEPPSDAWLGLLRGAEAYCEVLISESDEWWPQGSGSAAVAAGYTLDAKLHGALSADADWVDCMKAAGYTVEVWAHYLRCWRTRPLGDIVGAGDSLTQQAAELATWARAAIEDLSALAPTRPLGGGLRQTER